MLSLTHFLHNSMTQADRIVIPTNIMFSSSIGVLHLSIAQVSLIQDYQFRERESFLGNTMHS